jgi:hypothetical protein
MIFLGQIGTWQHKRKQIFKYVNLIKKFKRIENFAKLSKSKLKRKNSPICTLCT